MMSSFLDSGLDGSAVPKPVLKGIETFEDARMLRHDRPRSTQARLKGH